MSSTCLLAQPDFSGTWSGQTKVKGKSTVFLLRMFDNGKFTLAYDLNPNDLSVMGSWSYKAGTLSFKGSDEELQLKQIAKGAKEAKKVCTIEFRHGNRKSKMGDLNDQWGVANFFGWDKGVTSVVVNHEEQY